MGKRYCYACSNYSGKVVEGRTISLHRIPREKRLAKVWIQRLKIVRKNPCPISEDTRVCSEHFRNQKGPQPGNDVPSLFQTKHFKTWSIHGDESSRTMSEEDAPVKGFNLSLKLEERISRQATSIMFHDYCGKIPEKSVSKTQVVQETQTDVITTQESGTLTESIITRDVGVQCNLIDKSMHVLDVTSDDLMCNYTGIPRLNVFHAIFEALPPMESSMTGKKYALQGIDEFFLTLMRLRLGLPIFDLAWRFQISVSTCSAVISKWIDHLFVHLSFLICWPSKNQIQNTLPSDFLQFFPNTRVVIDCTELFTETPNSLQQKSLMYSHYKSHMTWKALIGITPNGVVSFVSDLWAGSISDKQIVIKSSLLDLCEAGDAIMADKGFQISDLTTPRQVDLIVPPPPGKIKKKQMDAKETLLTRRIANSRIHVERHMARVKNFKILFHLKGTMKYNASKIWKICNYLTTLQPPLHPHDEPETQQ